MFKFLITSTFFLTITVLNSQIDTISIYENKSGIKFKTYKKIWFPSSGSYSFNQKKLNNQDSIILYIDSAKKVYFKVYDKNNKLIIEGKKHQLYNHFCDEVIFYNKKGKIKRVENWKTNYHIDSLNNTYFLSDGPIITNKKIYSKGKLKKEVSYKLVINTQNPEDFEFKKIITKH